MWQHLTPTLTISLTTHHSPLNLHPNPSPNPSPKQYPNPDPIANPSAVVGAYVAAAFISGDLLVGLFSREPAVLTAAAATWSAWCVFLLVSGEPVPLTLPLTLTLTLNLTPTQKLTLQP